MKLLTLYLFLLVTSSSSSSSTKEPPIDYQHFGKNFLENHLRNYNDVLDTYLEPGMDSAFHAAALHNDTCMSNVEETHSFAVMVEFYWGRNVSELLALHEERFGGDPTKIVQPDRKLLFTNTLIPCDIRHKLVCVPRNPLSVRGAGDCKSCDHLHPEELEFSRGGTHNPRTLRDACDLAAKVLPPKMNATTVKPSGADGSLVGRRTLPAVFVAFSLHLLWN